MSWKNLSQRSLCDERCVPPDHSESNYGTAMHTLFVARVPKDCTAHRMEADSEDIEVAANRYATTLPERIDCLFQRRGGRPHRIAFSP